MPAWPEDNYLYVYMNIPSDEDVGYFANNISYAGFALWDVAYWDDSENTDLQDWIDSIDWD
jgi:hypothetical protein